MHYPSVKISACGLNFVIHVRYTSQPITDMTFVHTYTQLENYRSYEHSTYQTTARVSEMAIFWVRAACKIWLVSYGSERASQSLSADNPLVHNLKITGGNGCSAYRVTALLSKTFLVWFRVAWDIRLEIHVAYDCTTHQKTDFIANNVCSFIRTIAILYVSCLYTEANVSVGSDEAVALSRSITWHIYVRSPLIVT